MAAAAWLIGCLVGWCGGGRVEKPKSVAGRYFLGSAAGGWEGGSVNLSIYGVFRHILIQNRCFPAVPAMFFIHTSCQKVGARKLAFLTCLGGPGSLPTWVTSEALRKLAPPALARSSKKIFDPWSFEAPMFRDFRAWGVRCLEMNLEAWMLGNLRP